MSPRPAAGPVTAWSHPEITPVEVWDAVVGGATLFTMRDEPSFYTSLASVALALRRGEALCASGATPPALHWDSVALVGGAVDESRARDAFDAARIPLDVVSADPLFAVSHGREALLEQDARYADALVVDVGQTSIKAWGPGGRVHRPRPTGTLEGAAAATAAADPARAAFIEELAVVVTEACRGSWASFVLLGVPCEVTEHGGVVTLGASTYPIAGPAGPLVEAVLERGGHPSVAVAAVNDAVLAAWALGRRAPTRARTRLVLTVGLGVGAALVARAPAEP